MAKDAQVETVLRTAGGCMTTLAALRGTKTLDSTLRMVKMELQKEQARRDVTFSEQVHQKALKKGFPPP